MKNTPELKRSLVRDIQKSVLKLDFVVGTAVTALQRIARKPYDASHRVSVVVRDSAGGVVPNYNQCDCAVDVAIRAIRDIREIGEKGVLGDETEQTTKA